jgi:transposase
MMGHTLRAPTTGTLLRVSRYINPRRWVVERFFAWIGRNRRLAKDFEATIDSARAFLYAASVMLLVRRIARAS